MMRKNDLQSGQVLHGLRKSKAFTECDFSSRQVAYGSNAVVGPTRVVLGRVFT